MATNDLLNELQNDSIKLDDDAERKIVKILLVRLKDNNAEVQNLAVKWYGLMTIFFKLKYLFSYIIQPRTIDQ